MACLLPELLICYALDVLFVLRLGMGLFHACSPAVLVRRREHEVRPDMPISVPGWKSGYLLLYLHFLLMTV